MDIVIKQVHQKDYILNIEGLKTIQDLKDKLKNDLHLKTNNQILIYAGKELINEKNISDYNLQKGSTIIRHCKHTGG